MRRIAGALLWLSSSAAAARLETALEPRETRVGDRVTLTVTMVPGPGEAPLPFAPPADLGPFELVAAASSGPVTALTLVTFEVDIATVPALTFRYTGADGREREIQTPTLPVPVRSVLTPEDKDLKGLKGKHRPPPGRWWRWLLLVALAGAAYFAWALRQGKISLPGLAPPPPVPPDQEALTALEALAAAMEGPAKPYYSRLTDVLRLYIERRFDKPALDRTTAEMVPLLKELPLTSEDRAVLRELLDAADLAKFARVEILVDERQRHLEAVRAFVLATRPRPAAAEAAP